MGRVQHPGNRGSLWQRPRDGVSQRNPGGLPSGASVTAWTASLDPITYPRPVPEAAHACRAAIGGGDCQDCGRRCTARARRLHLRRVQPGRRASMNIRQMEGWRERISPSMDVTAASWS